MKRAPRRGIARGAASLLRRACRALGLPAFYESFLYLVLHWVVLATSWNILSGYSGYFSFGHGAFFGVGMYTTATLAAQASTGRSSGRCRSPRAVAALLGVALGAVVFRVRGVRGELFALLTLAVTFVLATIIAQHADRRRPGRLPQRGAGADDRADAVVDASTCWCSPPRSLTLLIAWRRAVLALRRRPVRDPRRRGRRPR